MITDGDLVAFAIQQPYLMGEKALIALDNYLNGKKVAKIEHLKVLTVSAKNIQKNLNLRAPLKTPA